MLNYEILKKISLFKYLNKSEFNLILPIVKKVSYKEGDVIIDEGEIGSEIFILTKGLVSVTQKLVLGKESFSLDKEKIVSKLSSENTPFFGEIAIFGDKKRT